MPSHSRLGRSALTVLLAIAVVFVFAPTVRAQGGKKSTASTTTNTTGNSSWEQAIAVLQAQVDQQAATIAQLQSALASETAARQTADSALQNGITSETSARTAAVTAEAAARQQGDADTLAAAKVYPDQVVAAEAALRQAADNTMQGGLNAEVAARQAGDAALQTAINNETAARAAAVSAEAAARQQGDADTLAAAKLYADGVVGNEVTARQAADTTLQNNINAVQSSITAEAGARKQGDADTLAAAKAYADTVVGNEAAARHAVDDTLQNSIAGEASVRQQGDVNTLSAANAYTDAALLGEAGTRQSVDASLQNQITTLQSSGGGGGGNTGTVPQQLLDLAPYLTVDMHTINGLPGPHVILTGVNFHVRNGQPQQYTSWPTFNTASYQGNGHGNLIVGYNDDGGQVDISSARGGSHNVVIGDLHRFNGNGGFLSGWWNAIDANATAVSGYFNGASGWASTVSGGQANFAVTDVSHVSGGSENVSVGFASSVTGGLHNEADGNYSAVTGGHQNLTTGFTSNVNGGENNWAQGVSSTVNGSVNQTAVDDYSTAP